MGLQEKTFLNIADVNYNKHRKQARLILNSKNKPYTFDKDLLVELYNRFHHDSIEELTMNWVFGYFMHPRNHHKDSQVNREAMFLEMSEFLYDKMDEGVLEAEPNMTVVN